MTTSLDFQLIFKKLETSCIHNGILLILWNDIKPRVSPKGKIKTMKYHLWLAKCGITWEVQKLDIYCKNL